jgi:glyoxylase-like metal-dependent hydrolase (beta-lactamase superfamily II)
MFSGGRVVQAGGAALCALMLVAACHSAPAPSDAAHAIFKPWIDGTAADEPQTQTQRYDRNTYVIRQSLRTSGEGPFLYLLFGRDRALLLDTGAGGVKIRPTVDAAIDQWLAENHRKSIPLVVAHTHGHGDHVAGDAEFANRPDTTLVGVKSSDVAAFFGIADWPHQIVPFDLGGRKLEIIPTPGHHPTHIMVFDERTRLLLSGDTLYPGRLYVPSNLFADYRASIDRVAEFTRRRHVSHILGAHIEMSQTPGKDFPIGVRAHPNEHRLELPYAALGELQMAVKGMGDHVARAVHDDFIVYPSPPRKPDPLHD